MTTLNYGSSGNFGRNKATFSIPSILAIICALGSFMVGPGLALVLCILAVVFGLIGVVLALLPHVRGGLISTLSIVIAVIGLIVAIVRLLTPDRPPVTGVSPSVAPPAIVAIY